MDKSFELFCKLDAAVGKWAEQRSIKKDIIEKRDSKGRTLLLQAIAFKKFKEAFQLIAMGANIHAKDNKGLNAFLYAARSGSSQLLKFLHKCGADIYARDNEENAGAMHYVVHNDDPKAIEVLCNLGLNIHEKTSNGFTPLIAAAYNGNEQMASFLLQHGAPVDDNEASPDEWPALRWAMFRHHFNVARLLIDAGANVMHRDKKGATLLHVAAEKNNCEMMQALLDAGADIDALTKEGTTPLMHAAYFGRLDCLRLLLKAGADIWLTSKDNHDALYYALGSKNSEVCKTLLVEYVRQDPDFAKSASCIKALGVAAKNNLVEMIPLLLARGVDVNSSLDGFWVPLAFAAQNGHVDAIKLLLRAGAYHIIQSHGGCKISRIAQENDQQEAYELLKKHENNAHGLSIHAFEYRDTEKIKCLIDQNPLLLNSALHQCINRTSFTPLMFACKKGNFELCDYLLRKGARVEVCNKYGLNAAYYAQGNKYLEGLIHMYERKNSLHGQILIQLWNMSDEDLQKRLADYTEGELKALNVPEIIMKRALK